MTREEAKNLLGENATEEQISNLLNTFHSEQRNLSEKNKELEAKLNSLASENGTLKEFKTKVEEKERENLTKEQQLDLALQEVAKTKKTMAIDSNSVKAKSLLVGAGIEEDKADELVRTIVKEDLNETLKSAELFVSQFNSIKEKTTESVKNELAKADVKPTPSNIKPDSNGMTWDKFVNLSNAEQVKFQKDHPEEFLKL